MVTSLRRLKTLEFLALLLADASQMSWKEGLQDHGLDFEDDVCQLLGAAVSSQLKQAVRQGALVEGRLETLVQGVLGPLI